MGIREGDMNDKWYERDWTEEIVIFILGGIAIAIVLSWDLTVSPIVTPGSEIVSGITGGLVGYLTRGAKGTGK